MCACVRCLHVLDDARALALHARADARALAFLAGAAVTHANRRQMQWFMEEVQAGALRFQPYVHVCVYYVSVCIGYVRVCVHARTCVYVRTHSLVCAYRHTWKHTYTDM